jgi:hypothetical protein
MYRNKRTLEILVDKPNIDIVVGRTFGLGLWTWTGTGKGKRMSEKQMCLIAYRGS